jgi:hypothetical protein
MQPLLRKPSIHSGTAKRPHFFGPRSYWPQPLSPLALHHPSQLFSEEAVRYVWCANKQGLKDVMVPQPRCTLYSVALLKGRIVPMEFPAFCCCVRSACFLRRAHTHRQPKARHETSIPSTHGHFIPTETNSTLKSTPNYLHRRFYHPVSLSWHFGAADSGSDTRFCLHLPSASVVALLSLIAKTSLYAFYFYCIIISVRINFPSRIMFPFQY